MIKILVADDHDLVRMGIVRMLEDIDQYQVVGEAKSGEEAVKMAREHVPDVILMDVMMPGFGGLEATRKIRQFNTATKIVAVTSLSDDLYPERLIKAGASGYVTKGANFDEMLKAIACVLAGKLYMSDTMAQQLAISRCVTESPTFSPFDALSHRELQTAIMITNGKKVQAIADTFNVSSKTVNSYRYRIFEKLNVTSDVELTILAVKHNVLDLESLG